MKLIAITPALAATPPIAGSDFLRALCEASLAMYPAGTARPPWIGYLAEEAGSYVGACAFKAPPDVDGVEIAYYTFPENEGQGVATRMLEALLAVASAHGVGPVRAHTLAAPGASPRVLEKLGFRRTGSAQHADEGEIWIWKRE